MSVDTVYKTLDELADLHPDFISVTYGAGGSANCDLTLAIANRVTSVCKTEAVVHMPCLYMSKEKAESVLTQFKATGIKNILALRGDRIEGAEPVGDFKHASDLVAFIKAFDRENGFIETQFSDTEQSFTIFGACYPEKHVESADVISDIHALKIKTDAGVSHLISQVFFDNSMFYRFLERARLGGVAVPIEAGIMPVINKKQIERMTTICGASLPEKFVKMMNRYGDSPDAMRDAGIAYAVDQIVDLITQGVDGIHLYTMNNAYVAKRISEAVGSLIRCDEEV